jgi:hypothetical protein
MPRGEAPMSLEAPMLGEGLIRPASPQQPSNGPQAWYKETEGAKPGAHSLATIEMAGLVLEKVAQVSQIVIAISLIVLCAECRSMSTSIAEVSTSVAELSTSVAGMQIDQGKGSPVTEIIATGIQVRHHQPDSMLTLFLHCPDRLTRPGGVRTCTQNGARNTFYDIDFLGVSALRNGTWVPAVVNSVCTPLKPPLLCLLWLACPCHAAATACVPCHDVLQLKLTATLPQLQLLHVDIHELAKSYKHVEKVASDVMDALVEIGVRGEYGDRPTPLNQTQSWQRIKALVAFVDTHMKGIQPQGANPPGFPSTVRAMDSNLSSMRAMQPNCQRPHDHASRPS